MILVLIIGLLFGAWAYWSDDDIISFIMGFIGGAVFSGLIIFLLFWGVWADANHWETYEKTSQQNLVAADLPLISSGLVHDRASYIVFVDSNGIPLSQILPVDKTTIVKDVETPQNSYVVRYDSQLMGNCWTVGCWDNGLSKYELHVPKDTKIDPATVIQVTK